MKSLRVSCAVIIQNGRVLCAQRNENMTLPLKWEFPGGKIENSESPEAALHRELMEELNLKVKLLKPLSPVQHNYGTEKVVELLPYLAKIIGGDLIVHEHKQVIWKEVGQLHQLEWAEADIPIVNEIQKKWADISKAVDS
jgi:8-oxo-dGTP diphosphatase